MGWVETSLIGIQRTIDGMSNGAWLARPFVFGLIVASAVGAFARAQISEAELAGDGGVAVRGQRALVGEKLYQRHAGQWTLLTNFGRAGVGTANSVSMSGERIVIGLGPVHTFAVAGNQIVADGVISGVGAFDVSVDGDRIAFGVPTDNQFGTASGAVLVYTRTPTEWLQTAKIVASDAAQGAQFGYSVSLRGDRVLVGARSDIGNGAGTGAAYVFDFGATGWTQSAKLAPENGHLIDFFGWSVALGIDRALVGAIGDDEAAVNGGAAYVLERSATTGDWKQVKKLTATNAANGDAFGSAVALAPKYAVIGAYSAKAHGFLGGAAWIYEREAGDWKQVGEVVQRHSGPGMQFGKDVAVDGDLAIVAQNGPASVGATVANLEQTGNALQVWPPSLSVSQGGQQQLALNAGPPAAGSSYWILGSATGTSPGQPLPGGFVLPLIDDAYFQFTLAVPNSTALPESLGALGTTGQFQTVFTLPAASDPALVGTTLWHAYVVLDPMSGGVTAVSNAGAVAIGP